MAVQENPPSCQSLSISKCTWIIRACAEAMLARTKSGKSGARAKIGDGLGAFGNKAHELGAVEEMARPDMRERAFGNEVEFAVPLQQQLGIAVEPVDGFM